MKAYELTCDIKPTQKQIDWQKKEFYGCIYYGMGTFVGENGGLGFSPATSFAPDELNTDVWAKTAIEAGMSGLLLNVKNTDGFCLWQTETTDYSVKSSTWLEGNGDLVKMTAESCRKYGLDFGIDIAFADLHSPEFKKDRKKYNEILKKQITELVTSYGKLFEVRIFDNDDIPLNNIDYEEIFNIIYENQPDAVISCTGTDVRWVGNSRGVTRKAEWSVVPKKCTDIYSRIDQSAVNRMSLDLGSRKTIKKDTEFVWYPCQVNVPMRSHFYYTKDDNYSVKTKDKLHKLYETTVGANAVFVLCLAPDKRGNLYDTDNQILHSFGYDLNTIYSTDLCIEKDVQIYASSQSGELYSITNAISTEENMYWKIDKGDKKPEITLKFSEPAVFDRISIMENIANGQHIEEFEIYCKDKKKFKLFGEGTVVGYKSITSNDPVKTDEIKIVIKKYRGTVEIQRITVH